MSLPVGYFPCTQDPPNGQNVDRLIDEIIEQAQVCEASGFDGFYFTEHHQQEDGYLPSPVLMAGLVGMKTERIKVGTCVLLSPLYHPIRLAEDIAIVDRATKGRMVVAMGIGYQAVDFGAFGVPPAQRVRRTVESAEIVRQAWTGQPFSYSSRYHTIENVRVTPTPQQVGGPPIWFAGWSPPGLERAGKLADGWIADPVQSLPVIKEFTAGYRKAAEANGRKPFVCLMRDCIVGTSYEDCVRKSDPTMVSHRFYFENGAYVEDGYLDGVEKAQDLSFERAAKDRLIAGSPEACLDQLQMWREEIRPDYLLVRMRQPGGPPQAESLNDIRLFGEKVIAKL